MLKPNKITRRKAKRDKVTERNFWTRQAFRTEDSTVAQKLTRKAARYSACAMLALALVTSGANARGIGSHHAGGNHGHHAGAGHYGMTSAQARISLLGK